MKSLIKYIGVLLLIMFSFYYADNISKALIYKSELMKQILHEKDKHETDYINAIITDEYIIPGMNGIKVNEIDSYYNMKKINSFSVNKLIYDQIIPEVSLENNKKYLINKWNPNKKAISIVLDDTNKYLINYAIKNNIKINVLTTYHNFDKNLKAKQINADDENYDKLESLLNRNQLNTNIYFVKNQKKSTKDKYLVTYTYIVTNNTLPNIKINYGDIIYIDNNLSLANFKILIKKIQYNNYNIIYLDELISEENNNYK